MDDGLQMHLLGSYEGEAFLQVVAQLVAKDTAGTRTRAVATVNAMV